VKVCDLTQFYSPFSGGVKRYLHQKSHFIAARRPEDSHVWIIPGESTEVIREGSWTIYTIKSPLVSRTSRYRFLWRLDLVERILEAELPDVVESGDPYQMAWKATSSARALGLASVGFYHSHFPEAYVRSSLKFLGSFPTDVMMEGCRAYVEKLYNRFDVTVVPSLPLAALLRTWGVERVRAIELGVDTECFSPDSDRREAMRREIGVGSDASLLLYVGRLASEKNVATLFEAFRLMSQRRKDVELLVVGDGTERADLQALEVLLPGKVHWMRYCNDSERLADVYRAADVFVHPGTQETFGLVTLESQACGTPVVAIRGSYMDRIIFTDLKYLATENSPESLVEAIESVLEGGAKGQGERAGEQVRERYSWDRVFRLMFDVYEAIARARKE
jgi:alpha-1,6-mannosyltransferase